TASDHVEITGMTAPFGPALITNDDELAEAGGAVVAALAHIGLEKHDGIIIGAVGDPALDVVRYELGCPVIGIGAASMAEAAGTASRFAVTTTTPGLADAIRRCADQNGYSDQMVAVRVTPGDPKLIMSDTALLTQSLAEVIRQVTDEDGAEA